MSDLLMVISAMADGLCRKLCLVLGIVHEDLRRFDLKKEHEYRQWNLKRRKRTKIITIILEVMEISSKMF